MSFTVDPDSLDKFADLLERYTDDSKAIFDYFQQATIGSSNTGLFVYLADTHELALTEAGERMALMHTIGTNSSKNVRDAARSYREIDADNAAELDATYPSASHAPLTPEDVMEGEYLKGNGTTDAVYEFKDTDDPNAALLGSLDAGQLEPQVEDIDAFVHWAGDQISIAYWIRTLLKELHGLDPFEEAVQFVAGDWRAIARCSLIWANCKYAAVRMSNNLVYTDNALARVWEGNAADAAIDYFQRLHTATAAEGEFFGYLADTYAGYVEIVYDAQQILNDLLNFILDQVLTVVAVGMSFGILGPPLALVNAVGKVVSICTGVVDVVRVVDIVNSYIDLPDKMPDSLLQQLGSTVDPEAGYQHPES